MSQEEIEAMLAGMAAGSDESGSDDASEDASAGADAAAGDETAAAADDAPAAADSGEPISDGIFPVEDYLTRDEQDLLGEVGNICMGTSATTMSLLLGRRVNITTPKVSVQSVESLSREYPAPLVVSEVKYVRGLDGDNLLVLKEYDVALITNLMLGESLDIDEENIDLTEIHMSAIGEVMNQMVGSSATALADLTHQVVDISTPETRKLSIKDNGLSDAFESKDSPFVKVSFVMEIEDLLTSEIMQILTVDFARELAGALWKQMQEEMGLTDEAASEPAASAPPETPEPATPQQPAAAAPMPDQQYAQQQMPQQQMPPDQQYAQQYGQAPPPPGYGYPPQQQMPPGYGYPGYPGYPPQQQMPPGYGYIPPMDQQVPNPVVHEQQSVRVQQPQFPSFSAVGSDVPSLENIEMILDVPMSVTVELGRTKKKIRDILEFNTGSVVVLDRPAGEMVDIMVNGKLIGKGEVVVIDDNYGVRISEINVPNAAELL